MGIARVLYIAERLLAYLLSPALVFSGLAFSSAVETRFLAGIPALLQATTQPFHRCEL